MKDSIELAGHGVMLAAIRLFGGNAQIDVAVEEMAELTQALVKAKRYATDKEFDRFRANVIEEIADVEIMLEQLRIIFGSHEKEIDDVKTFKLKRLADRLKEMIPDTEEEDT